MGGGLEDLSLRVVSGAHRKPTESRRGSVSTPSVRFWGKGVLDWLRALGHWAFRVVSSCSEFRLGMFGCLRASSRHGGPCHGAQSEDLMAEPAPAFIFYVAQLPEFFCFLCFCFCVCVSLLSKLAFLARH